MNTDDIRARLEKNSIPFDEKLPEKLFGYFFMLNEWNSRMDLTAVKDENETLDRHFVDSLTVLKTGMITGGASLIDVGTGAGFPGMVLAMARPDLHVTLLDSQQKRIRFLKAVSEAAGTGNVRLVHARAEDGARMPDMREQYDIAAARAVAPLNTLCEYLLPYVRVGGYALCWKGPGVESELESGRRAACLLGGSTEEPVCCRIEGQDWEHMILPIRKVRNTAAVYPRKAGMPKSNPLGI